MKSPYSAIRDLRVRPLTGNRLNSNIRSGLAVRKALVLGFALAACVIPDPSDGALITQFEPVYGNIDKVLNIDLTNNDPGAIYDSGSLSSGLFGDLGNQLLALPTNHHYGNLEGLMGAWTFSIRGPPTGNVYNGWNRDVNPDGRVELWNSGRNYDQWTSTPGANTMALTVRIPLSQLELDAQPGYNPDTDARIELGTRNVVNAFVANTGSPAEGLAYNVIPEPGTGLLIGLGCMAFLACRRMFGKP